MLPLAAYADAIPGATYQGTAADGASVTFTVSSDGTIVDSYRLDGVRGDTCAFYAEGDSGVWSGAPINNNVFDYELGDAISLKGVFTGAQTASGTFRLHNDATSSKPACDTGIVQWSANTTATPPPPGSGGSQSGGGNAGGSGGSGGGGSGGHGAVLRRYATFVVLRRGPHGRLDGWLRSTSAACRARRTVILWRGSHRFASTKSKANGTFWFVRSVRLKGHVVRASAVLRMTQTAICSAGSSIFITG
jgi:hypothetical protein